MLIAVSASACSLSRRPRAGEDTVLIAVAASVRSLNRRPREGGDPVSLIAKSLDSLARGKDESGPLSSSQAMRQRRG